MIYVDTNIVVSHVNSRDPLHEAAERLLARRRGSRLVVSQLVVTELYAVYSRTMGLSDVEVEALVEYSLSSLGASVEQVDCTRLFAEAQKHASTLRLRTLDLLHVVSAYLLGADAIATLDRDIVARRRVIRDVLGLEVYTAVEP